MSQHDQDASIAPPGRPPTAADPSSATGHAFFLQHYLQQALGARHDIEVILRSTGKFALAASHPAMADTKALVTQVLLDTAENYSVSGYNDRAHDCFGKIYLGLDKGAEYDRQSSKVNAAIQGISASDSFTLALQESRKLLADKPNANYSEVIVATLAAICSRWFDLPDACNVVAGDVRLEAKPPPRCPGDFALPSYSIFYHDPDPGLVALGREHGAILKAAVAQYLAALRAAGRLPTGVLSRAVFDSFPKGEDDLIARTLIGIMMGMLPTVQFNLGFTLDAWGGRGGATFRALQDALTQSTEPNPYERARGVLLAHLIQAMQNQPMPPEVWRTAVKDHMLGTTHVPQGSTVKVAIETVTRQDLASGITDAFPIFGGDRSTSPYPTHACPGHNAAIGIMLGVINGLMEPN